MGETTGIEWADATWNPWIGCTKVSPACAHCYAEREMTRWGRNFDVVMRTTPATFNAPLHWKEGKRVFTCSWSDFFHPGADAWRVDAYNVIAQAHWHTYLILTKRPQRIPGTEGYLCLGMPQVWLGVSVENSRFYWRIEDALKFKHKILFLSIEPLLGRMADLPLDGVDWVIVGGESGEGFRPLNLDWVREIRDRCVERGIAFFFKQKSAFSPKQLDRLLDGREWNQVPVAP
jgi:protein gp37